MKNYIQRRLRNEWREEIKRYPEMDSLGSADWWIEKLHQAEQEMLKRVRGEIEKGFTTGVRDSIIKLIKQMK